MPRIGLDHVVMAAAVACLIVLVVLPVGSLILGSFKGEAGVTFDNFREALTGRLYVQALKNSLELGAWTALFSVVIGVPLAWAVARTNAPGKPLIRATATLAYLSPPFLTAIAFVNLFGPNAGLINKLLRDVLGLPWLTFNILDAGSYSSRCCTHSCSSSSPKARRNRSMRSRSRPDPRRQQMAHRVLDHRAAGAPAISPAL
jgi:ABC-type Fe3+ transport system permease subunit